MEELDRVHGQLEPLALAEIGGLELLVGLGHMIVGVFQLGIGPDHLVIGQAEARRLACCSSPLARACTAETAPSPARAISMAAPAAVTPVRCRVNHRTSVRVQGSRQAVTGSSAIQRSTSSARALHEA